MLLNGDTLSLTVPVSIVPALSWANGAQCSPARTQTPSAPSAEPSS